MSNKILNSFNVLFIILYFPSLVSSVFVSNLLYFFFILINLIFNFNLLKNLFFEYKILSYLFITFYLILVLSSLSSLYIIHSLQTSLLYITFIIYIFSLIILFRDKRSYRVLFYFCGIFVMFILSVDAFYELINGKNIFGNSAFDGRIAGLFGDRWVIGRYLAFILPILISLYLIEFNKFSNVIKIISSITFFLSITIVFFSGERAAFIGMLMYLTLLILYLIRKISLKKIFLLSTILISLVLTPFLFSDTNKRLQDNFIKYISSTDMSENQYLAMYATSFKIFKDNPIIGSGPNNFRKLCSNDKYYISKYSCSTHPHNIHIQLLAEVGFLGFMFIYSIFLYFLIKLFYLIKSKSINYKSFGLYSLQCSIIIYLWPIMVSGNFFLSWYGILFYLPISIFLLYTKNKETT